MQGSEPSLVVMGEFQLHPGAIEGKKSPASWRMILQFQLHPGAIEGRHLHIIEREGGGDGFQLHPGAIEGW